MWNVQQDIPGLMSLMGGEKKFVERLDQLFLERLDMSKVDFFKKFPDQTGLIGNFGMGNQGLLFSIPYLYNYTGSAWKTQKMTRLLLDTWFQRQYFWCTG